MCGQKPGVQFFRTFLATVLKCGFKASAAKGNWSASWPLLGITDLDESDITCLTTPTQEVPVTAYQKEKMVLAKAFKQDGA